MDITEESALQYAQRLGLFQNHTHGQFSPQSCLTSIQTAFNHPLEQLAGYKSLSHDIDLPNCEDLIFALEPSAEKLLDEPGCAAQTRSPFSYQLGSLKNLLLELPDMGSTSSTEFDALSHIIGFMPKNCLISQHLPLFSMDQKEDQGLGFPPHIDRLHQALLYKLDNKKVRISAAEKGSLQIAIKQKSEVFSIQEDAITPPQSPKLNHSSTEDNSKGISITKENNLGVAAQSPREVKVHRTSKSCDSDSHKQQTSIQHELNKAANSRPGPETTLAKQIEDPEANHLSHERGLYPLEVNVRGDPSNSFFEEAFFSCPEDEMVAQDIEIESIASILDRIDGLLLPLPNISTSDLSHLTGNNAALPILEWESYKHLPPIPIDPALEEALPWAPLPRRCRDPFEAEAIAVLGKRIATETQEIHCIGTIGTIEDGKIEECSEVKKAMKPSPTPPSSNSLDSLIRLRLQRNASEQVQPPSYCGLWSQSGANKTILPSADDAGATSKLVSAFMSLRGVPPPRSKLK